MSGLAWADIATQLGNETNLDEVLGDVIAFIHANLPGQPGD
ncbi:MAG TPA: hypothetical protein VET27_26775 [Mycobacterium sp.]|nr:hypothetical protein [Mycobacterium sp.]